MVKRIMLAVAAVALIAAPAFAAVQNVKVGGSIATTSILSTNVDTQSTLSSAAGATENRGNDILTQTQLDISADLTDNVSTKIGLLNERLWGNPNTAADDAAQGVDIETAYVSMKEFLYSPLTVVVGRQPLFYGNGLIIGQNTSRLAPIAQAAAASLSKYGNFDAIKAVLSYDPLTVDLFASRISSRGTIGDGQAVNRPNNANDNMNLFGVNANYKLGDKMNTVAEAYFFAKMDDTTKTTNIDGTVADTVKAQDTYVPGLRVSTNPIEGLNIQLEGAYQFGHVNTTTASIQDTRNAYALQGIVNYALPVLKDMNPVLSAEYKYLSGEKVASGAAGVNQKFGKAWDPMFEKQDNGRIYDELGFGNSNLQLAKVGFEVTPIKDLTTALSWNGVWLAEKRAYSTAPAAIINSSKYVGSEIDADLTYAYTEDVKLGLSAGLFLTGKTYVSVVNKDATQILTSVDVAF